MTVSAFQVAVAATFTPETVIKLKRLDVDYTIAFILKLTARRGFNEKY